MADYESRLNIYFCSLKNESIVRVFRHTFWKCDITPSCIIFLKSTFLNESFWIPIFSQDYCINNQNWLHLCLVPCQSPCLNKPRKFKNGPAPQVLKKPSSTPWHNNKRRVCILAEHCVHSHDGVLKLLHRTFRIKYLRRTFEQLEMNASKMCLNVQTCESRLWWRQVITVIIYSISK